MLRSVGLDYAAAVGCFVSEGTAAALLLYTRLLSRGHEKTCCVYHREGSLSLIYAISEGPVCVVVSPRPPNGQSALQHKARCVCVCAGHAGKHNCTLTKFRIRAIDYRVARDAIAGLCGT